MKSRACRRPWKIRGSSRASARPPSGNGSLRSAPSAARSIWRGLFAAKEAVAKALGTGFTGFGFADIEILPEENGRPTARLTGGALNALPLPARIHVSISHDGGLALAFAVIESA